MLCISCATSSPKISNNTKPLTPAGYVKMLLQNHVSPPTHPPISAEKNFSLAYRLAFVSVTSGPRPSYYSCCYGAARPRAPLPQDAQGWDSTSVRRSMIKSYWHPPGQNHGLTSIPTIGTGEWPQPNMPQNYNYVGSLGNHFFSDSISFLVS